MRRQGGIPLGQGGPAPQRRHHVRPERGSPRGPRKVGNEIGNILNAVGEAVDGIYRTGMIVALSGIYDVIHDKKHNEPHQVTCVKGDKFPPCRGCTSKVRFKINTIAEHIKDDAHLR